MATEKRSANEPFVLSPGEGTVIPAWPPGSSVTVKVGGPFLQCLATAAEGLFDPSQGAPGWTERHLHHRITEISYVLEGDMTFLIGEEVHRAEAGSFICIPPETVHAYIPSKETRTKVLFISIPGGFEGMFEEGARMPPDADPFAFWQELHRRYDTQSVGPPPEK